MKLLLLATLLGAAVVELASGEKISSQLAASRRLSSQNVKPSQVVDTSRLLDSNGPPSDAPSDSQYATFLAISTGAPTLC